MQTYDKNELLRAADTLNIRRDDIMRTYSGKQGCACGCLGKYATASKHLEAANADMGYDQSDDVNDRSVKLTITKMIKLLKENDVSWFHADDEMIAINTKGRRSYTAYFAVDAAQKIAERAARKAEYAASKKNAEVEAYESFFARAS